MGAERIEVLGTVGVRIDGVVTAITSPTQRLLLALLAAARPQAMSRERLMAAVWPDGSPPSADNSLNSHLSRLRRTLGSDAIIREGGTYRLALRLDADVLDEARGSITEVRAALGLWGGDPFGELGDHPFLHERAEQLRGRQRALRRRLVDQLLDSGEREEAVTELQALVRDRPLDEASWSVLVSLLTELDRRAEALRAAQAARSGLAEVGLMPSEALQAAEQAALDPRARDEADPVDSLIGRRTDLDALQRAVEAHRLVTIVGPGGVGKTSLVLAHLEEMSPTAGRPVVCELAAADSTAEVELTIAQALGATPIPPIREQIATELRRAPRTLVLDACEHRLDDVRSLISALGSLDGLRIITTSRSPISMRGERLLELGPLDENDSVELLCRRTAELGEPVAAASHAAEICRRVDHLPLGIELASSLLRVLEPDELLERLDDTIDVLRSPTRPGRHRSLRATVEHSIELLAPVERSALLRLSTFVGPFTLDRAEELLGSDRRSRADVAATVAALRDASLLHPVRTRSGRRLTMLDTVRAVVRDHLRASDEHTEAHAAHVRVAAHTAGRIASGIITDDERRWAALADDELADLRAAHRRALDLGDAEAATTIVTGIFQYAYDRICPEVGTWAEDSLDRLHVPAPAIVALSASAALGAFQLGDLDRATELAEIAQRSTVAPHAARGGVVLANVHLVAGRLDDAMAAATAAASDAGDDVYLRGLAELLLAVSAHYADDEDRARASARRLDELAELDGVAPSLTAYRHYCAAELSAPLDPAAARSHLQACLATARSVGNVICEGVALVTAGTLTADDDPEEARREFLRTITHWRHRPDRYRQWITLRNFAVTLARCDDLRTAAFVLGAAETHAPPAYGAEAERIRRVHVSLDDGLGTEASAQLRHAGAASDLAAVVSLCLEGTAP